MDSLSFTKGKISFIQKAMSYTGTRILIMIFFFLFIYQIIYAIGVFFAINTMVLSMWLCWLAMFVIFVSFLPVRNGMFYVKAPDVSDALTVTPAAIVTGSAEPARGAAIVARALVPTGLAVGSSTPASVN